MKRVVIIGGGLAGCASAEAFSRRGWRVQVLEARNRLGGAVAGLPLIAQHPGLTPDFDLRSRLLVQSMQLHGRLRAGPAVDLGPAFEVCGRLQPMDRVRAERCVAHVDSAVARVASAMPVPRWPLDEVPAGGLPARDGYPGTKKAVRGLEGCGVWFPDCAAVSPRRWWQAVQQRLGVSVSMGIRVGRVDATATGWRVVDDQGNRVADADVVVLACREQALTLAGMQEADHGRLRLSAARVWLARADGGPPDEDPGHPALLPMTSGRGLVLTRPGSFWLRSEEVHAHWLQAGEADSDEDPDVRAFLERPESWQPSAIGERLQLRDNLPMIGPAPDLVAIAARADDLARNDRLPMPQREGLYLLTGMAGRGALYAAIGAEMIAARACGEPDVVDARLAAAVSPARFIKRRLQRAWSGRGKDPAPVA